MREQIKSLSPMATTAVMGLRLTHTSAHEGNDRGGQTEGDFREVPLSLPEDMNGRLFPLSREDMC